MVICQCFPRDAGNALMTKPERTNNSIWVLLGSIFFLSPQIYGDPKLSNFTTFLDEKYPLGGNAMPHYLIQPLDEVVETKLIGNVKFYNITINGKQLPLPKLSFNLMGLDTEKRLFLSQPGRLFRFLDIHIVHLLTSKVKRATLYIVENKKHIAKMDILNNTGGVQTFFRWNGYYNKRFVLRDNGFYEVYVELEDLNGVALRTSRRYFQVVNERERDRVITNSVKATDFFSSPLMLGKLNEMADLIKTQPDLKVLLIGFSDQTVKPGQNQKIGLDHAMAIRDYILRTTQLTPEQFRIFGFDSRYLVIKSEKKNSVDLLLTEDIHNVVEKLVRKANWKLLINDKNVNLANNGEFFYVINQQMPQLKFFLQDEWGSVFHFKTPWPTFKVSEYHRVIRPLGDWDMKDDLDLAELQHSFKLQTTNTKVIALQESTQSPQTERIDHALSLKRPFLPLKLVSYFAEIPLVINKGYEVSQINLPGDRFIVPNRFSLYFGFSPIRHTKSFSKDLIGGWLPTFVLGFSGYLYRNFGLTVDAQMGLTFLDEPFPGKEILPENVVQKKKLKQLYGHYLWLNYRHVFNRLYQDAWLVLKLGYHMRGLDIADTNDVFLIRDYEGLVAGLSAKSHFQSKRGIEIELFYSPFIEGTPALSTVTSSVESFSLFHFSAGMFFSWLAFDAKVEYFYDSYYGGLPEYQSHQSSLVAHEIFYGIRMISTLNLL